MDLVEHLAQAAADAVRKRRRAIEGGEASNLNGITVELSIANGGGAVDVTSYLSWKDVVRRARRGDG